MEMLKFPVNLRSLDVVGQPLGTERLSDTSGGSDSQSTDFARALDAELGPQSRPDAAPAAAEADSGSATDPQANPQAGLPVGADAPIPASPGDESAESQPAADPRPLMPSSEGPLAHAPAGHEPNPLLPALDDPAVGATEEIPPSATSDLPAPTPDPESTMSDPVARGRGSSGGCRSRSRRYKWTTSAFLEQACPGSMSPRAPRWPTPPPRRLPRKGCQVVSKWPSTRSRPRNCQRRRRPD